MSTPVPAPQRSAEERAEEIVDRVGQELARLPSRLLPPGSNRGSSDGSSSESDLRRRATNPLAGLAWYAGLGTMAALKFIEWPIAAVIGVAHAIEHDSHNRVLRELAEGVDSGA